jgi:hypothetical protein
VVLTLPVVATARVQTARPDNTLPALVLVIVQHVLLASTQTRDTDRQLVPRVPLVSTVVQRDGAHVRTVLLGLNLVLVPRNAHRVLLVNSQHQVQVRVLLVRLENIVVKALIHAQIVPRGDIQAWERTHAQFVMLVKYRLCQVHLLRVARVLQVNSQALHHQHVLPALLERIPKQGPKLVPRVKLANIQI